MNNKRSLSEELNMKNCIEKSSDTLDIDIEKIKEMVNGKASSASSERKFGTMKSKKKISLIAIAATFVLGVTVFAASGVVTTWFSSSSSDAEYKSLPSGEQVMKDVGYEAIIIDEFQNGYAFKDGNVKDNYLADENGNSVDEFKSVTFEYVKDDDRVTFFQEKFDSAYAPEGSIIATVDGVDIYYYGYTNKVVPTDYKMTEEDKAAEESGDLIFSWGSSEVEIIEIKNVSWVENGMQYSLLQMDGELSADELADMAAEVIKK